MEKKFSRILTRQCTHQKTWRRDVQHNDARNNDVQQNEVQRSDSQHNDIQQNGVQHNGFLHNDVQKSETQHNDIYQNGVQFSIMTLCIKILSKNFFKRNFFQLIVAVEHHTEKY